MISRYLNFTRGVAEEYNWLRLNVVQQKAGCLGIQRIPYDDLLELIEYEKSAGSGHVGPFREILELKPC